MTAGRRRTGARARALGPLLGAVAVVLGAQGCGQDCCTVDSLPIPLARAPLGDGVGQGGLLARAVVPGVAPMPFQMVVDTGSPVTILAGPVMGTPSPRNTSIDLLDARVDGDALVPVRARFRSIGVFTQPVGAEGDAATRPGGILGGDLLRAFSIELRFGAPCAPGPTLAPGCTALTFWRHQGASTGFLSDAGYAVLRFNLMGGGETSARTQPDSFGLTAPVTLAPTRVVLRACGVPPVFVPDGPVQKCCARGDEFDLGQGVDLALLLATGTGPLVLAESAWARVEARLIAAGTPPPPRITDRSLHMASWPTPIDADWSAVPRFTLVDLEAGTAGDPGPCVELARARRIEWVARDQQRSQEAMTDVAACVQLCDTDPADSGKAQNSAAYVELAGAIPVAIVKDTEAFLQGLSFDVSPEGPQIDGVVGAGALAGSRLELDYRSEPARAIFSCEADAAAAGACRAASRCARLPDRQQEHLCFGLPAHHLPATCGPSTCP